MSYSGREEAMSEEPKMAENLQMLLEKNELLKKHEAGALNGDERVRLHQLLKEKYSYGDEMPEYRCPQCKKPMIYTWVSGPICIKSVGGCGYSFN